MNSDRTWRFWSRLSWWRQAAIAALGIYVVAMVAFLAAGGADPNSGTASVATPSDLRSDAAGTTGTATNGEAATNDEATASDEAATNDEPATSDEATASDEPATNGEATASDDVASAPACNEIDPAAAPSDLTARTAAAGPVHQIKFNTLDDEPASLGAYAGCPLVVNFFASWCVPCVTEMPEFEQFWSAHGEHVAVVGLAVERAEPARAIVAETGVTYPAGVDDSDLLGELGGVAMPTTVFVSPGGEILLSRSGILTLDALTERAAELFALPELTTA